MEALDSAVVSRDIPVCPWIALGIPPVVDVLENGADYLVSAPSDHGISIFPQHLGDFTLLVAQVPYSDDALILPMGVLDLSIHPIAILGIRCDEYDHSASPI